MAMQRMVSLNTADLQVLNGHLHKQYPENFVTCFNMTDGSGSVGLDFTKQAGPMLMSIGKFLAQYGVRDQRGGVVIPGYFVPSATYRFILSDMQAKTLLQQLKSQPPAPVASTSDAMAPYAELLPPAAAAPSPAPSPVHGYMKSAYILKDILTKNQVYTQLFMAVEIVGIGFSGYNGDYELAFNTLKQARCFREMLLHNGIAFSSGGILPIGARNNKHCITLSAGQVERLVALLDAYKFDFPPSLAKVLNILCYRISRNAAKAQQPDVGTDEIIKAIGESKDPILQQLWDFVSTVIRERQGQPSTIEQLSALERQFSDIVNGVDEEGKAGHDALCKARTWPGFFKSLLPGFLGDVGSISDVRDCLGILQQLLTQARAPHP